MDNYTKLWIDMDADELQTWEREVTRRLEDAKTEVTTQEQALAAIRTELRQRKLAAFWQENEGLRLEVGDKIVIIAEYVQWYEKSTGQRSRVDSGEIYTITDIDIHEIGVQLNTDRLYLGAMPLDIARRMRLAYLQAHGEAQP